MILFGFKKKKDFSTDDLQQPYFIFMICQMIIILKQLKKILKQSKKESELPSLI